MKPCLLIVEDDESIRTQLKWGLMEDYELVLASDRPAALKQFCSQKPPVVLLDLGLPPSPGTPEEGLALMAELIAKDRFCKIIIATGQSERESAVQAIGAGAYDFLSKPVDMDELMRILRRALHVSELEREFAQLQELLAMDSFAGLAGASPAMELVFNRVRKVAPTDAAVLILGESGTGKELTARAIHNTSPRRSGPFVAINCGAIPENLLESELFGHEKGSFTGAVGQRKGRVESASGGTLFLDEIGEFPMPLQVKLLRFLQERTINRVGGNEEIPVDVRVLSATNSELGKRVESGTFREDLYYRLAVVGLQLPPLRERDGDIPLLAQLFLQRFCTEMGKKPLKFSPEAMRAIQQYVWPGNVRELENRVRRAAIMAEERQISAGDLELDDVQSAPMSLREARELTDRRMVEQALMRCHGHISNAAKDLGVSRPTLYELMDKLGLREVSGEESL